MIYDCFLFLNEFDLLEIRLRELEGVVDRFVIVEADRTFTHNKKPFRLLEQWARFERWWNKISYVMVSDIPENATPSNREKFQRNCITRGLPYAKRGDTILIGDIDEIPRPSAIKAHLREPVICGLRQTMYRHYLNCATGERWIGTKIVPQHLLTEPDAIRWHDDSKKEDGYKFIEDAGWHFTSTGGADALDYKLKNFAHAGRPWHPEEVQGIRDGTWVETRGNVKIVSIDETHPKFVRENLPLMKQWGLIYEPAMVTA